MLDRRLQMAIAATEVEWARENAVAELAAMERVLCLPKSLYQAQPLS